MAFFDGLLPPQASEVEYTTPSRGPDHDHPPMALGVSVAGPIVIASTVDALIGIESVVVYPTSIRLDLVALLRRPIAAPDRDEPWHTAFPTFHCHWPPYEPGPGFIPFGVRYADGRRFTNLGHYAGGGSSGPLKGSAEFWIHELPPPGPVSVYAMWKPLGIPETASSLDGEVIRHAGTSVTKPSWS